MGQHPSAIIRVISCISDDKLQDITFSIFLKRLALLSAGANISDPVVEQQIGYAIQVLWELLKKSNHSLKQKFAKYVADESHLIIFMLEAMCTYLESYSKFMIKGGLLATELCRRLQVPGLFQD